MFGENKYGLMKWKVEGGDFKRWKVVIFCWVHPEALFLLFLVAGPTPLPSFGSWILSHSACSDKRHVAQACPAGVLLELEEKSFSLLSSHRAIRKWSWSFQKLLPCHIGNPPKWCQLLVKRSWKKEHLLDDSSLWFLYQFRFVVASNRNGL